MCVVTCSVRCVPWLWCDQALLARSEQASAMFGLSPEEVKAEMYHVLQKEYCAAHKMKPAGVTQLISNEPWRAFWVDKCGPWLEVVRVDTLVSLIVLFLTNDLKLTPEDLERFTSPEGQAALVGTFDRSGDGSVSC